MSFQRNLVKRSGKSIQLQRIAAKASLLTVTTGKVGGKLKVNQQRLANPRACDSAAFELVNAAVAKGFSDVESWFIDRVEKQPDGSRKPLAYALRFFIEQGQQSKYAGMCAPGLPGHSEPQPLAFLLLGFDHLEAREIDVNENAAHLPFCRVGEAPTPYLAIDITTKDCPISIGAGDSFERIAPSLDSFLKSLVPLPKASHPGVHTR